MLLSLVGGRAMDRLQCRRPPFLLVPCASILVALAPAPAVQSGAPELVQQAKARVDGLHEDFERTGDRFSRVGKFQKALTELHQTRPALAMRGDRAGACIVTSGRRRSPVEPLPSPDSRASVCPLT
ncbi:MAG: hypothetical protein C5B58_07250 [Acidobacteria bacterium]|nr:MAG: hypothetical protein C5B58_07250 [Acidobacteriota bacterium]